jgi:hypothetical protein
MAYLLQDTFANAARQETGFLPEILLETAARTDFTAKFTHISPYCVTLRSRRLVVKRC